LASVIGVKLANHVFPRQVNVMVQRILVIMGHPDIDSYNEALAEAYARAAQTSGAEVRMVRVGDMKFDPVLWKGYKVIQELEPDLKEFQKNVLWADHLVWFYPDWWGTMPALLKGLIDRMFLPAFGFKYHGEGLEIPEKLLKGRTARLVVTMDAPPWYYRFFMGAGYKMMRRVVLGFCGISPVRITSIGPLKIFKPKDRERWIAKIRVLGAHRA
jgi:putative NADPH-quinone reductase